MQIHLPQQMPRAHGCQCICCGRWARGIAIVAALIAAPIVLAVTWLAVFRGLL